MKLSKLVNGMGCALVISWNKYVYVCVHGLCDSIAINLLVLDVGVVGEGNLEDFT